MRRTGILLSSQIRPVTAKKCSAASGRGSATDSPLRTKILTIVTVTQLVGKTVALLVEEKTADAAKGLGSQELDLGVRLVRVDETGRVNLDFVEVDTVRADLEGHLGTVTLAVLSVRRRQVEEFRAVLGEQSIFRKVCGISSFITREGTASDHTAHAEVKRGL